MTRFLRQMVQLPRGEGLTDAQLLERFVTQRDATAFEILLWRHGPKVLGVCRRVLRHEYDAEDAFQVTFLVLLRKASSIGKHQSVGSWLHRVAYRVALRAKMLADRRAVPTTVDAEVAQAECQVDPMWADLRPVLDEEINRLPAKYRAPFILCYLDGKTNQEAAHDLGCPKGTILSRLAWARERLRVRLTRRGLTLTTGLLTAALTNKATAAPLSAALLDSTLKAMLLVAAGKSLADVVSKGVAVLAKGTLQAMLWTKIKIVAICMLTVTALVLGGALTLHAMSAAPAESIQGGLASLPNNADPAKTNNLQDKPPMPKSQPKLFAMEFRDQPWAKVFEWYVDISGLPFIGTSKPTGSFTFIPPGKRQFALEEITDILNEALLAQKYILIRRAASFTVLPADEQIDPSLVPRVQPGDLEKRGRTEVVSVMLPLKNVNAKELAADVKKLLGPFGSVAVLEKANQLLLMDTVHNLVMVRQMIQDLEGREGKKKSLTMLVCPLIDRPQGPSTAGSRQSEPLRTPHQGRAGLRCGPDDRERPCKSAPSWRPSISQRSPCAAS
jgi:RNA polymerase sigma factor (sigma-70 family)